MKKEILLKEFLNPKNKIAVNCRTKQEATAFFAMLHKHGVIWCAKEELEKRIEFQDYRHLTCYIAEDFLNCFGIGYANVDFYKENGYTIYKYNEIEFVEEE